jgi:hypothetical protein
MADQQQSASSFGPEDGPSGEEAPFEDPPDPLSDGAPDTVNGASLSGQAAFATEVARQWVKGHQKEAMVGAFAVGVFFGSWFRS